MGWYNDDGLYVKFGTEQAETTSTGEYSVSGSTKEIEIEFDTADLEADGTATIMSYAQRLPLGARIEKVEVAVYEAFVGGTSIDVGTIATDTTTAADPDGFVDAELTADLVLGALIEYTDNSGDGGDLIGTALDDQYLMIVTQNGTFTAGKAKVRIRYSMD